MVASSKRKVEVSLLGQRFTLRSEKSEEYVQAVAKYVTQQLEDVRKQTRAVSTHHVALLVALNLADQLLQKEDEIRQLKQGVRERTQDALKEIQQVMSLLPNRHKGEGEPADLKDEAIEALATKLYTQSLD